jgi:hypothetical protein
LNEFEDQPKPHYLRLADIDVAAPLVLSGTIVFAINITLDNTGGPSEPVRLVVKAFDTGTELLTSTNQSALAPLSKDETRTTEVRLDLPRVAGYRFEVSVYESKRIVQSGQTTVSHVAGLPPNLFETGLRIASMDFLVRNVSGSRVDIETSVYITNEGTEASRPLRMEVKAREVSTSLLADEASAEIGAVEPEATRPTNVLLDVPANYNYEVEAVLWDGDYIVERGTGRVQLLPTFTKPAESELVVSSPKLSDFIRAPGAGAGSESKAPGFEWLGLVAALGIAVAAARGKKGS